MIADLPWDRTSRTFRLMPMSNTTIARVTWDKRGRRASIVEEGRNPNQRVAMPATIRKSVWGIPFLTSSQFPANPMKIVTESTSRMV